MNRSILLRNCFFLGIVCLAGVLFLNYAETPKPPVEKPEFTPRVESELLEEETVEVIEDEIEITDITVVESELIVAEPEISDFGEEAAAEITVELSETGVKVAPRTYLNRIGSTSGTAMGGRGRASRASQIAFGGNDALPEPINAPVKTWRRAETVPNTSRLTVGHEDELPLKGMQYQVRIDGFRARVLIDFHFLNDRQKQLEGTFQVRLPDEASPYFFAFGETQYESPDVPQDRPLFFSLPPEDRWGTEPVEIMEKRKKLWKEPKEARVVPRDKANHAYHQVVRRRVDPALMEWSGAGVFSARVFPLQPQKMHRIVIGYEVNLLTVGEDLVFQLDLPKDLQECMVAMNVSTPDSVVAQVEPKAEATPVGERTYYHFEHPKERRITLRLSRPGVIALKGFDNPTKSDFFAVRWTPDLPEQAGDLTSKQAVFLVDVSLSSQPDKFNIWLKLLRQLLEKNRDSIKKFNVLFFNIENFWWHESFVENNSENTSQLLQFCRELALEGATDLGSAFSTASNPDWNQDPLATWNLFLLSDATATWGEADLHALTHTLKSPHIGALLAYKTGLAGTDTRSLEHLTRETGGAVFSVVGEQEIEATAVAHRQRPWRLLNVELEGTQDRLVAGRPDTIYPGQLLTLVGRGQPANNAKVKLTVQRGNTTQTIHTKIAHTIYSSLTPRHYGQVAVAQLEDLGREANHLSQSYATHFRVTGRACSLLMLETEQDYLQYNIQPGKDSFTVRSQKASNQIQTILAQNERIWEAPKQQLLAWLERMEKMPGVRLNAASDFRNAVMSLPKERFVVEDIPLECKQRTWECIPKELRVKLASKTINYAMLTKEAQRRRVKVGAADSLRVMSSLVEMNPGDRTLLSDLGFAALEWELNNQAYFLFRRAAQIRRNEPHAYWQMAKSLHRLGNDDLALIYYEVLYQAKWHDRFRDWNTILRLDYQNFLQAAIKSENLTLQELANDRLKQLTHQNESAEADLVVTLVWNTDATDIDLHVTEPTGECCNYKNPQTKLGGRLSSDVTQGFGPEMYRLGKAQEGHYQIAVKYYSGNRNRTTAPTKVYLTIYRNWGRKNKSVEQHTVTLKQQRDQQQLATISIK